MIEAQQVPFPQILGNPSLLQHVQDPAPRENQLLNPHIQSLPQFPNIPRNTLNIPNITNIPNMQNMELLQPYSSIIRKKNMSEAVIKDEDPHHH